MKLIHFIPLLLLLSGCDSISTTLSKIPPNSFDKIEVGATYGPFYHVTTFLGGAKQTDGSMLLNSAIGQTTFMGWGSKVEITNLHLYPGQAILPTPAK